jgi:ferric enterobactin receptor
MIRRLIFFVFAGYFIFMGISYGQGGKIQGTIKMADGTPLPGVTVSIEGTSFSTTTDRYGLYSFTGITRGRVTLIATLDGFKEAIKEVVVSPAMTIVVDILLEIAPLTEETVVEAERPLLSVAEEVSEVRLTPKQIETLPSLGEKDIFRALQLLPGISGSQESSSG